jgi:outer membrane murein-binding lipoprotein Lpp
LDDVAKRTQDNYQEVNNILKQLDPLNTELQKTERELDDVENVNQAQQQLLARLKTRLDKVSTDKTPASVQQKQKDADERDAVNKQLDQTQTPAQPQVIMAPGTDAETKQKLDQLGGQVNKLNAKDNLRTFKYPTAVSNAAKQNIVHTGAKNMVNPVAHKDDQLRQLAAAELNEDIYESRLYRMRLAGYFD